MVPYMTVLGNGKLSRDYKERSLYVLFGDCAGELALFASFLYLA
jgi:hypothetical protein